MLWLLIPSAGRLAGRALALGAPYPLVAISSSFAKEFARFEGVEKTIYESLTHSVTHNFNGEGLRREVLVPVRPASDALRPAAQQFAAAAAHEETVARMAKSPTKTQDSSSVPRAPVLLGELHTARTRKTH